MSAKPAPVAVPGDGSGLLFSIPARENRASNPYTAMLADGMEALGWQVSSPRWKDRFRRRADVIHVHWPQRVCDKAQLAAVRSIGMWLAFLGWQQARGAKVVWTTHNLQAHDARSPAIEAWYMRLFTRRLDGFIALSEANRRNAIAAFPALRDKPSIIVPHPVYGDAYPPAARAPGLVGETVAFLGDIKPYKGLDSLLAALERAAAPDSRTYLIGGRCSDRAEAAAIASRIAALSSRGWNIERDAERLSDQAMADALARTDLLVQPYHRGENSGLSLLAAERGVPMLLRPLEGFRALGDSLGPERVCYMQDELDHPAIIAALDRTRASRHVPPAEFVAERSVQSCALTTDIFFRDLCAQSAAKALGA